MKAAKVTKTPGTLSKPPARDSIFIKINNHVTFYDKYDILSRGIVKWIGTEKSTDKVVVGIEVVRDNTINHPHFACRSICGICH